MCAFAICLVSAGAVLSLFARVPLLLAVLCGTAGAILAAGMLSFLGVEPASSTPLNVLVAIVALQFGYGSGIVARAALQQLLSRARVLPMAERRGVNDTSGR